MCNATRDIMDCMFEAYLESTLEPDDIPTQTSHPVWILGKKYDASKEMHLIRRDISSKLWFTYRKNFVPIGGDCGMTSDKGWGCMLRCGQMVLAQALINVHLGRDWYWDPETKDSTYLKILRKFEDRRQAPFSIHQIAMMGASEGKDVGQWFSPNVVAQVLKKLIKYDDWCSLTIHVALHNTVVINEIKKECTPKEDDLSTKHLKPKWIPLLLIVPLRLGLTELNPIYISGIKKCFQFRQSLGIIGGKPNLALYFIGCVGDEVIYLDPHTTHHTGFVENKETDEQIKLDYTYHRKYASRMNILSMDPSVAVCFYCGTEEEFNELCQLFKDQLIDPETQPLFEICLDHPKQWSPPKLDLATAPPGAASLLCMEENDRHFDSDEFEII